MKIFEIFSWRLSIRCYAVFNYWDFQKIFFRKLSPCIFGTKIPGKKRSRYFSLLFFVGWPKIEIASIYPTGKRGSVNISPREKERKNIQQETFFPSEKHSYLVVIWLFGRCRRWSIKTELLILYLSFPHREIGGWIKARGAAGEEEEKFPPPHLVSWISEQKKRK